MTRKILTPASRRPRRPQASPPPKRAWKPGNLLAPVPVVLVSCGGFRGFPANLITIAWVGTVCSDPPMLSIAVRPERFSFPILKKTGEFVVNLPSAGLVRHVDWCGVKSGREVDKFAATGLTPLPGSRVSCPIVAECPVNLECRTTKTIPLGSHTLFLAEILAVQVSAPLLDGRGRLALEKAGLMAYVHGDYAALGRTIGRFGFSVRKRRGKSGRT
ncbi:MAG: flavin reductase family protein [Desulfobacterales bacterium]